MTTLQFPTRTVSFNGQDIVVYLEQSNSREDFLNAEAFMQSVTAKSYGCKCCGKRVQAKDQWISTAQAALTASKLCFDCMFWMCKANDAHFLFIGGRSVSFYKPTFYTSKQQLKAAKLSPYIHVVRLHDGTYATTVKVFSQGEIAPRFRELLADNAQWLCPLCLKPLVREDGSYGWVCNSKACQKKANAV